MAKRPDDEANDAATAAKDFARDEMLGARHWKRSKLGYLTGASAVKDGASSVTGTGKDSVGRVTSLYRAAFAQDKSGIGVGTHGDSRERFLDAMVVNGRTIEDIDRSVDMTYRQFWFYLALSGGAVLLALWSLGHYGIPASSSRLFQAFLVFVRFAPLAALGPLVLRAGWTNWAFRRRRLDGVPEYLRSGALLPKRANSSPASGSGRAKPPVPVAQRGSSRGALSVVVGLTAAYAAFMILGIERALADVTPSNIFVDPNQGDMFMRLLAYVIPDTGPVGSPVEGAQKIHNATKVAFQAFSGTLLFIGMAMSGWHILSGLVASAKEGTAIGRNYHEVWAPARVVVGFGMLTPIAGGICGAQLLVLYLIAWGGNLANAVYSPYIDSLTSVQTVSAAGSAARDTVAVGNQNIATQTVKAVAEKELCWLTLKAVQDRQAGDAGSAINPNPTWKPQTLTDTKVEFVMDFMTSYSTSVIVQEIDYGPVCGKLTVNAGTNNPGGVQRTVSNVQQARFNAIQTLQGTIRGGLQQAVQSYQPTSSSTMAPAFKDNAQSAQIAQLFQAARRGYLAAIQQSVQDAYRDSNSTQAADLQKTAEESKKNGWATAGVYYLTIARISNAVYSASTEGLNATQISSAGMDNVSDAYKRYLNGVDGRQGILPQFADWWQRNMMVIDQEISSQSLTTNAATTAWGDVLTKVFGYGVKLWNYTDKSDLALNPMQAMIDFGNRLMIWGSTSYVAGATLSSWAGSAVTSLLTKASAAIGVGIVLDGLREAAASLGTVAMMLSLAMVAAGALHAYIIPIVPYIMTVFFVASMLVLVVEALVAAPIWAFVHIRMDGQEFIDQVQKPGYMIAFNLILRPSLMIFGLILSYTVFGAMMWFIAMTFLPVTAALGASTGIGPIGMLVLIAVQSYLDYQVAMRAFQLVLQVPDRVTRWFGQGGENLGEDHESSKLTGVIAGQVTNRADSLAKGSQFARGGRGKIAQVAQDTTGANNNPETGNKELPDNSKEGPNSSDKRKAAPV